MSDPSLKLQAPPGWEAPDYEDNDADLAPGPHEWRVTSLVDADRSLARQKQLCARKAENMALYEAAIARANAWLEKQNKGIEYGLALHRAKVEEWAQSHRAELLKGGKVGAKSRSLPNGRVGWRAKPEKFEVQNKDALAQWAIRQDPSLEHGLVDVQPRPVMAEIKRYCQSKNLIPDGVVIEPAREDFVCTPAEDEPAEIPPKTEETAQ